MKPRTLRLLIMHVSTRCDQTCAHCSIWKTNGKSVAELGVEARLAIIEESRSLGAGAVLFTGGEPLQCEHLETLARAARGVGLSVQIATNGLGLSRSAPWLAEVVDEIYVSVEGPESLHDKVRGPRMFSRLKESIASILAFARRPRLIGRSVVTRHNASALDETVMAARLLGLDAVSFLPVDLTSEAFGGDPSGRSLLRPGPLEVAALRRAISRLSACGDLGTFVLEDQRKLSSLADRFLLATTNGPAPACNAPEWSSVVDADGGVRPCFFQPRITVGGAGPLSLDAVRRSENYAAALRSLGDGDPICASCVCPKRAQTGLARWRSRAGAFVRGVTPRLVSGGRSAA